MLSILMLTTNLYRWLHLQGVLGAFLSYNLVYIDIGKDVSTRLTSLLISSIVYVEMRCIEFVFVLHTLIYLLVLIYLIKIPFQIWFKSDLTCLSADICMYERESKIQICLRLSYCSVQAFSEVTVLA